jgi:outer membrane protein assembly factor BamB
VIGMMTDWKRMAVLAGLLLEAVVGTACGVSRDAARVATHARDLGAWPTYQLGADHNAVIPSVQSIMPWTYDTHARINGGLAVVSDTVYIATFAPSVVALSLNDGSVRWEAAMDNVVMSTPIIEHGHVVVGTGTNHHLSPMQWGRKQGDHVVSLDTSDGRVRWQLPTVGEDMPSPVYAGKELIFANGDAHVYAVRADDGRLLWRSALSGISTMASATTNGTLAFISTCDLQRSPGVTTAVEIKTGAIRWTARYGNCDSAPTLGAGNIFVSGIQLERTSYGYGYRAVVAALDPFTGVVRWQYRSSDIGYSSMVVSSERAVAGTYANRLYLQAIPTHDRLIAFDAATGRKRWTFQTLAPAKMSPVVRDGFVYIGDTSGCLYTLQLETGRLLHMRTFNQPFSTSPPVIVGNTFIVAIGSEIHAMPIRDGVVSPPPS